MDRDTCGLGLLAHIVGPSATKVKGFDADLVASGLESAERIQHELVPEMSAALPVLAEVGDRHRIHAELPRELVDDRVGAARRTVDHDRGRIVLASYVLLESTPNRTLVLPIPRAAADQRTALHRFRLSSACANSPCTSRAEQ